MAGVYFHVPFCKQACHYCDFHFSTSLKHKEDMLGAMIQEMKLRADYLNNKKIETIYFGGGTPSTLEAAEINLLIQQLANIYEISSNAEITLEANPDDLNLKKVTELRNTPINRFSIGIQSFYEEDLKWMNRAHNAQEADSAIKRVQDAGFENITADLIYGFPLLSDEKWLNNIHKLIGFQIPHISAYSLTIEPRTALAHFIKTGKQPAVDDEQSAEQFLLLMEVMSNFTYEHYEISNFALQNHYAVHNTNYWKSTPYLGIGPSAHSYNGLTRQWNINNNVQYINAIMKNTIPAEVEVLTPADRLNEYIMTSLRTVWGLDLDYVERTFGSSSVNAMLARAEPFKKQKHLLVDKNHLKLTTTGKLLADNIAAELFTE